MGGATGTTTGSGGASTGVGGAGIGGTGVDGAGVGGTGGVIPDLTGVGGRTQLRLLTQSEYKNSITSLLPGAVTGDLDLPDDTSVAGFKTVGASEVTVNELAAEAYETASRRLTTELFADAARWPTLVGCTPQPDLSDTCVDTYVRTFGRRAFRRDLSEEEAQRWISVARNTAVLAGEAVHGLATATSGMLQSPYFLYRVESAEPDQSIGRIRFDGTSMATRLAYLLTGAPPNDVLLDAAAQGQLDTAEGIRTAASGLVAESGAVQYMAEFFTELALLELVLDIEKDAEAFPDLDEQLRASMLEEARRWIRDVVLAPGADVRSFFDSTTTFIDGPLAELYGVQGPSTGFGQIELGAETGRAGILGKASFLMAHSSPDSSNPTRRGYFILKHFLCQTVPPPPPGVNTSIEVDPSDGPMTTRQMFEEVHRVDATCVGCHQAMDPFGFALEHFDPVGRYRATENGLTIDATGEFGGVAFDGALELGEFLRNEAGSPACMIKNFYRYANGTSDETIDTTLIGTLATTLAERNYVWRDLLVEFVASNAFISISPDAPE